VPPAGAARVRGDRGPLVRTPAFALWLLGQLADMELESLRRASRRYFPKKQSPVAAARPT
jgi:hypothetical protein